MTKYAIIEEKGRFIPVPHDRVRGKDRLFCHYTGHIEAAWKFCAEQERRARAEGFPSSSHLAPGIKNGQKKLRGLAAYRKKIAYGRLMDEADANAEPA